MFFLARWSEKQICGKAIYLTCTSENFKLKIEDFSKNSFLIFSVVADLGEGNAIEALVDHFITFFHVFDILKHQVL